MYIYIAFAYLVPVGKNKTVYGRCYQLRDVAPNQIFPGTQKVHFSHAWLWVYLFFFLTPFSYGYNFSQLDSWIICVTIEQMTDKGCVPSYSVNLHTRVPTKCLDVVLMLQELWWDVPAWQGCCFLSLQKPLDSYQGQNLMAGTSLCPSQSHPGVHWVSLPSQRALGLWVLAPQARTKFTCVPQSYSDFKLEELLKTWRMMNCNCHWLNNQCGFLLSEKLMFFTIYFLMF